MKYMEVGCGEEVMPDNGSYRDWRLEPTVPDQTVIRVMLTFS